jgi:hypothetical protein
LRDKEISDEKIRGNGGGKKFVLKKGFEFFSMGVREILLQKRGGHS